MKKERKSKGDIYWYSSKRKRPIGYSTRSVFDTIKVYFEFLKLLGEPITPNNLLRYFEEKKLVGLYSEKEILMKYVQIGEGDKELFLK